MKISLVDRDITIFQVSRSVLEVKVLNKSYRQNKELLI